MTPVNSKMIHIKINYVTKSKILGHIMTADNKMNEAVKDRQNKARNAFEIMNKKFLFNKQVNIKIKLRIFNALILSMLLYGLQIIPINVNIVDKLQKFYSKCVRCIAKENYDPTNPRRKLKTNQEIRKGRNVSTIESTLKLRYKLYKLGKSSIICVLK